MYRISLYTVEHFEEKMLYKKVLKMLKKNSQLYLWLLIILVDISQWFLGLSEWIITHTFI